MFKQKKYKEKVGKEEVVIVRDGVAKNPKTGSTLIVLSLLLITTLSTTILLKKNKKVLTILLLVLSVSLIPQVKAESQTIKMVDSNGKALKNHPVKIYAESKLSYEEVKVIISLDTTKTYIDGGLVNERHTTFLDNSSKKQITYRWNNIDNE